MANGVDIIWELLCVLPISGPRVRTSFKLYPVFALALSAPAAQSYLPTLSTLLRRSASSSPV